MIGWSGRSMIEISRGSAFGLTLLLSVACCWLIGCGSPKQGQLPTAQVTGEVTYRSAPLARGEIKFIPVQTGGGARVAYGTLDGQGRYRLGTYGQVDGAILGDYQVVVESREEISADAARQATKYNLVRAKPLIPDRYTDPNKSGLTAHVAMGDNTLNFGLKD
jgi:hypothetical protein